MYSVGASCVFSPRFIDRQSVVRCTSIMGTLEREIGGGEGVAGGVAGDSGGGGHYYLHLDIQLIINYMAANNYILYKLRWHGFIP